MLCFITVDTSAPGSGYSLACGLANFFSRFFLESTGLVVTFASLRPWWTLVAACTLYCDRYGRMWTHIGHMWQFYAIWQTFPRYVWDLCQINIHSQNCLRPLPNSKCYSRQFLWRKHTIFFIFEATNIQNIYQSFLVTYNVQLNK